jgi:hypothetical protein
VIRIRIRSSPRVVAWCLVSLAVLLQYYCITTTCEVVESIPKTWYAIERQAAE